MALKKYEFNKAKEIEEFARDFSKTWFELDKLADECFSRKYLYDKSSKREDYLTALPLSIEKNSAEKTQRVGRVIADALSRDVVYSKLVKKQEKMLGSGFSEKKLPKIGYAVFSPALSRNDFAFSSEQKLTKYVGGGKKIDFYNPNEVTVQTVEEPPKIEVKSDVPKLEEKVEAEYITFEQIIKLPEIGKPSNLMNITVPKIRKEQPDLCFKELAVVGAIHNVKYVAGEKLFEMLYEDKAKAKAISKNWKAEIKKTEEDALISLLSRIERCEDVYIAMEDVVKLPGVKKYWDVRKNIIPEYAKRFPDVKVRVDNNPKSGFKYKLTAELAKLLFDDETICDKIVYALGKKPVSIKNIPETIDDKVESTEDLWVTLREISAFDGARKGSMEKLFLEARKNGQIEARQRISDRSRYGGAVQTEYKFTKKLVEIGFVDKEKGDAVYAKFARGECIVLPVEKKDIKELLDIITADKLVSCEEISSYEGLFRNSTIEKKLREAVTKGKIVEDRTLSNAKKGPTKFKLNQDFLYSLVDDLAVAKKIEAYSGSKTSPFLDLTEITNEQLANAKQEEIKTETATAKDVEKITDDEWVKATTTIVEDNNGTKFSNVLKITLQTGQEFVFKPLRLQREQQICICGKVSGAIVHVEQQCLNEAAAWIVDDAFGFGLIEKTIIKELSFTDNSRQQCKDFGAIREYLPEFYNATVNEMACWPENVAVEQINNRKALKFVINDKDQKPENWGFDGQRKKIVMLDNALAFDEEKDAFINAILGEIRSEASLKEIIGKIKNPGFKQTLTQRLGDLNLNELTLTGDQIQAVLSRAEQLFTKLHQ